MYYVSSYFIFLFTIQLILILRQAPSLWLLAIWGLFFLSIVVFRKHLLFSQDHPHAHSRKQLIAITLASLVLLAISHSYFYYHAQKNYESIITSNLPHLYENDDSILLSGRITSSVMGDGNRVRFDLLVDHIQHQKLPKKEKVRVTRYALSPEEVDAYTAITRGDLWQGHVKLSVPDLARNPGAFNYNRFLFYQNIHYVGQITDQEWMTDSDHTFIGKLVYHLDDQRNGWIKQIERIFSPDIAPIVQAMTIGYRTELDPVLVDMYQRLGIIHILAISGLHVGIIIWALFWALTQLPITREKVIAILLLFIPFYIYISGAQVSVVRAGLMAMIVLLCIRFHLWKHSLLGLYAVYILTLLIQPYSIFNVGYQLSFLVTFALISGYPFVERLFEQWKWPQSLKQVIAISLLAQLASIPIIIFHFYQLSPFSLFINIILVPIYSILFIPAAFVLTLISFIHIEIIQAGVYLYETILRFLHKVLHRINVVPYSTIHFGRPPMWWYVLYVVLLLAWLTQLERGRWRLSWTTVSLIPVLLVIQLLLPYMDREAKIMMLDVGQGDAIVIELPYRKEVLLIDLGGQFHFPQEEWMKRESEFEVGREIILPYLKYRGINKVHKIIITHGHYDHFGGIQGLLGQIDIDLVLRSPIAPHSVFEQEWINNISRLGIPIASLGGGDEWSTKQAYFHILFPEKQAGIANHVGSIHDYNVVVWNQIYQTSFLWTGDVEEIGEREILHHYPQLKADILKIAHHGSNTSTTEEWLNQVLPKVSLISLSRNNRYGHPHPMVSQRLEEYNSKVYRTDVHGGIMIKVNPTSFHIVPTLQESTEGIN
jgi:competence protein ComEC